MTIRKIRCEYRKKAFTSSIRTSLDVTPPRGFRLQHVILQTSRVSLFMSEGEQFVYRTLETKENLSLSNGHHHQGIYNICSINTKNKFNNKKPFLAHDLCNDREPRGFQQFLSFITAIAIKNEVVTYFPSTVNSNPVTSAPEKKKKRENIAIASRRGTPLLAMRYVPLQRVWLLRVLV